MDLSIFKNKYPWSIDIKTKEVARKIKGETVYITTGEVFNNPAIITHKRYDSKQFTKVYQDLIKAKYGFKPSTQRIVDFIIANLPKNEPVIAIDLDVITSYFRGFKSDIKLMSNNKIMSAHAYGRALKELQEKLKRKKKLPRRKKLKLKNLMVKAKKMRKKPKKLKIL